MGSSSSKKTKTSGFLGFLSGVFQDRLELLRPQHSAHWSANLPFSMGPGTLSRSLVLKRTKIFSINNSILLANFCGILGEQNPVVVFQSTQIWKMWVKNMVHETDVISFICFPAFWGGSLDFLRQESPLSDCIFFNHKQHNLP